VEDDELEAMIAREFLALADVLEGAPADSWDTPSLCERWRVREVVAHMTMPARYTTEEFMAELQRCNFDFTRLSNEVATRDAERPTSQLVDDLRSEVLHHWTPPESGRIGALTHVLIHTLDATVPLGREQASSDDATRRVLDGLTKGGGFAHFGVSIEGRRVEASDLDWSFGSGRLLKGDARALVLTISGRPVAEDRLEGAPLEH
jgi:uncharacterized protein (TIGR03083 family)